MSRRRFFVESVHRGQAELTGEDAKHLTRVLRVEPGQRHEISDNQRVWLAEVETAHKENVTFRILEPVELQPEVVSVTLCAALIKFDHFEWMLEKATELGVTRIVPVIATRCEHGLDRAAPKRSERWNRILVEASQQSRRDRLPELAPATPLRLALERETGIRLVLDESRTGLPLFSALPKVKERNASIAILVGPEGGWTEEERARFEPAGWISAQAGPLILRAETAAMAALAVVANAWNAEFGLAPSTQPDAA